MVNVKTAIALAGWRTGTVYVEAICHCNSWLAAVSHGGHVYSGRPHALSAIHSPLHAQATVH